MIRTKFILAFSFFYGVTALPSAAISAQQIESLAVGYSSLAGHHTPMWVAVEDRIGKKYGIDLKAVYAFTRRDQERAGNSFAPISPSKTDRS